MKTHYTQSEVLSRGWTLKLIQTFLGEPDSTAHNYHNAHAARMKLYLISRVFAAERSEPFQIEMEKRSERKAKAKIRADGKMSEPNSAAAKTDIPAPANKSLGAGNESTFK